MEKIDLDRVQKICGDVTGLHLMLYGAVCNVHLRQELADDYQRRSDNLRKVAKMGFKINDYNNELKQSREDYRTSLAGLEESRRSLRIAREVYPLLMTYIDSMSEACRLERIVKRLRESAGDEAMTYVRLDLAFVYYLRAFNTIRRRDEICPTWQWLHTAYYRRLHSAYPTVKKDEDSILKSRILSEFLIQLLSIELPSHTTNLCKMVQFSCRYLDDEVRNLRNFLCKLDLHFLQDQLVMQKVLFDFTKPMESIERIFSFVNCPNKLVDSRTVIGLLIMICLKLKESCLAERLMNLEFKINTDRKELICILRELRTLVRDNVETVRAMRHLTELNGQLEGVSGQYEIPVIKSPPKDLHVERPWWVQTFKHGSVPALSEAISGILVDRQSAKVAKSAMSRLVPCSISDDSETCSSSENKRQLAEAEKPDLLQNMKDTASLLESDLVPDDQICSLQFPPLSCDLGENKPIILGDKDYNRRTNLTKGGIYFSLILSYDAVANVWCSKIQNCRVVDRLVVSKPGANRDPILFDTGPEVTKYKPRRILKMNRVLAYHRFANYVMDIRTHNIARYYVERFRDVTNDQFGKLRMVAASVFVAFDSADRRLVRDMGTEEAYMNDRTGETPLKFVKFTNNHEYKNREIDTSLAEAFSHFTFQESESVLMVTDIQGWVEIDGNFDILIMLTDPAIHCPSAPVGFFDRTNLGNEGFDKFWSVQHRDCNHICSQLGLVRP